MLRLDYVFRTLANAVLSPILNTTENPYVMTLNLPFGIV